MTSEHFRYALAVQYAGGEFSGWQRQPNVPTVQGALEQAAAKLTDESITLQVAGRTDAGVHATGQIASFSSSLKPEARNWQRGLNALTPASIYVSWVHSVAVEFHPRYDATSRRYTYIFYDQQQTDPFISGLAWCCSPLDADVMHQQAQCLLGEHDFSSFRGAGCQSLTPMRRVDQVLVRRQGAFVVMEIEANAFLLHMVRNIASGLLNVGLGAADSYLADLLAARDRTALGVTAPPQGLYLSQVRYPHAGLPAVTALPPILRA
jgi:tRNA pseudouridine38-40 synthase